MAFTENKGIIGFDSELSEGHLVRLLKGPFPEFIGELSRSMMRDMLASCSRSWEQVPVWSRTDSLAPAA